MKAAVLHGHHQIMIQDLPLPSVRPDEVLVRVKSAGICGSDLHYWRTGAIGNLVIKEPLILGHELSGQVVDVGRSVSHLSVGDRVVVEPASPCGSCRFCRTGRYNLCPEKRFMGDPPNNGGFAEYVAWPAAFVYRMPPEMTFDEGALVEPLSIGTYSTGRANITPGDRVLVMGAGPIGLMTLIAALTHGATEIYVVDVFDWRLEVAKEFGATSKINATTMNVTEKIQELTKGEYVDVAMETSGSPDAAAQSVKVTRRGGTIALVGLYDSAEFQYPLLDVLMKEISVVGNYDGAHSFPISLQIMASRKFDVKKMVTHHLPLDKIETGFKIMEEKKEHVLKIQVHP